MKLPKSVRIAEVGPRDGLQNLPNFIPTEKKIELIEKLILSGIKEIELTSFVHPKSIPQMADASEVASSIVKKYGEDKSFRFYALVPNVRGAENAVKSGLEMVCVVISASEAHNKANINRSIEESINGLSEIINAFPELIVRLDVGTALGCPFEGDISIDKVVSLIDAGLEIGVKELTICDTIGIGNPFQTEKLVNTLMQKYSKIPMSLHLHDTRGMGLANVLTGMQCGIDVFETSIGGLGGCPFAPGAAGNTATEDTVNMLSEMGIETGIDHNKLYEAVYYVRDNIKNDLISSHMVRVNRGMSD